VGTPPLIAEPPVTPGGVAAMAEICAAQFVIGANLEEPPEEQGSLWHRGILAAVRHFRRWKQHNELYDWSHLRR
jgi:hypothetical protein